MKEYYCRWLHLNILLIIFVILITGPIFAESSTSEFLRDEGSIERSIVCESSMSADDQSPAKIYYFLKHLDRYYLNLSKGHKKFYVTNASHLGIGATIEVEETAGNQHVKHNYQAVKAIKNKYIMLVSDPTTVNVLGFLNFRLKTSVEFKIQQSGIGNTILSTRLILEFNNKVEKLLANLIKTQEIWENHLKEELENGLKIIASEKFMREYESDKIY
jgi:hypothetical protein